jgi:hypothetical protein
MLQRCCFALWETHFPDGSDFVEFEPYCWRKDFADVKVIKKVIITIFKRVLRVVLIWLESKLIGGPNFSMKISVNVLST